MRVMPTQGGASRTGASRVEDFSHAFPAHGFFVIGRRNNESGKQENRKGNWRLARAAKPGFQNDDKPLSNEPPGFLLS
jgi:hypothetical protein